MRDSVNNGNQLLVSISLFFSFSIYKILNDALVAVTGRQQRKILYKYWQKQN